MKNIRFILTMSALSMSILSNAQGVGIDQSGGTPHQSAMLDVNSSDKGILIPRIALTGTDDVVTILSPAESLMIYNTNTVAGENGVQPGFYYWDGLIWKQVGASSSSGAHYVGELFGGGIVFWVSHDGTEGLVATLDDLSTGIVWGGNGVNIPGASSGYNGAQNTVDIVSALGAGTGYAAGLCDAYSGGGFTDWYLPAFWELNRLFNEADAISRILAGDGNPASNGFSFEDSYWASTETNETVVRPMTFSVGSSNQCCTGKLELNRVRAIRKF